MKKANPKKTSSSLREVNQLNNQKINSVTSILSDGQNAPNTFHIEQDSDSKSVSDTQEEVSTSINYRNHVTNMFRNMYYEMISVDLELTTIKEFQKHVVGKEVGTDDIRDYIMNLPMYNKKWKSIVQDMILRRATNENKENAPVMDEAEVEFYLSKLKTNSTYSVDSLYQDILDDTYSDTVRVTEKIDHNIFSSEGTHSPVPKGLEPSADGAVTSSQGNEFHLGAGVGAGAGARDEQTSIPCTPLPMVSADPTNVSHGVCLSDSTTSDSPDVSFPHVNGTKRKIIYPGLKIKNHLIQSFETIFNRPMFVQEYFKLVIEGYLKCANEENEWQVQLKDIYQKFVRDYNETRKILSDYTNTILSEYDFVKEYLYAVDDEAFFIKIIDTIVAQDLYKSKMMEVLSTNYDELFREKLTKHDTEYVFNKVIVKKLSLHDEHLTDILESLKQETNDIVEHINFKYEEVLQRLPDVYECQEHIQRYRKQLDARITGRQFESLTQQELETNLNAIDQTTEHMLIECLEFHDIIKDKVRRQYSNIKPRPLFQLLQKITKIIPGKPLCFIETKITELTEELKKEDSL